MSPEVFQIIQFIGTVVGVSIYAFLNQRSTNRKIDAGNDTLSGLKKTIAEQATQISNQNDQIAGLRDDLEQTKKERDARIAEVTRLNDRLDSMQRRIDGLEATNTQAAQDLIRLTSERNAIEEKHRQLEAKYTKALEDAISMGGTIGQQQEEMDVLKLKLATHESVDEIVRGLREIIGTAIREGIEQAFASGELMKIVQRAEGSQA